jgi:hypothetical protein
MMISTKTLRRLARLGAAGCAALLPLLASALPANAQTVPDAPPSTASTPSTEPADAAGPYVLPFAVLRGDPSVHAGRELAVFLWHDAGGLHLRTTGPGPERDFTGVLRATGGGHFFDLDRVRVEHGEQNHDRVNLGPNGRTIAFHFDTFAGVDGFDTRLGGQAFCLELVAGRRAAAQITHLGGDELRPDQLPVCFRR